MTLIPNGNRYGHRDDHWKIHVTSFAVTTLWKHDQNTPRTVYIDELLIIECMATNGATAASCLYSDVCLWCGDCSSTTTKAAIKCTFNTRMGAHQTKHTLLAT